MSEGLSLSMRLPSAETQPASGPRVIFINRYFAPDISATSQMLSELCFALVPRGFRVVVLTSRSAYDAPATSLPPRETLQGVDVHRVWTTRFGRGSLAGRACDYLSFYLSALVALLLLARRGDVVVAKTDPPLVSVVAAVVAGIKGARLVNWLQDVFPEVALRLGVLAPGALSRSLRRLRNWSLVRARRNVVIGERMAALLVAEGVAREAIEVIPNWADGALIAPVAPADNPLRAAWGYGNSLVVGYSGNLGRAHEFDTLLGAAERLANEADIAFLFIGGGRGNQQLRAAVEARGLRNLQFQPYQAPALLAQSLSVPDVHLVSLLPAMEGLIVPSKIYGIAAAGRPCIFIGDPAGEVAGLLAAGGFGLTVAPGDSEALAAAILGLREDAAERHRLGQRARAFFDQGGSVQEAAARWDVLLREDLARA